MTKISEVSRGEASSSSPLDRHGHGWKYDVFLSFRGEDTRKTFVDHLYSAFARSGIFTFKDNERLETGESIPPVLFKAIEESMFAIVVFSKNYATSKWCLDELVKIMECHRDSGKSSMGSQRVFPIFYDVEPSDVRKPDEGYFGEILIRKHDQAKVEMWRKALGEAANFSGLELKNTADGHEAKFIDIVVDKICRKVMDIIPSHQDEGLVGMKSRIEEVITLLDLESDVVLLVGIWGSSGIGKTTLANALFCRIKNQFQAACFLKEVGEESKRHGLNYILQQLLSELLGPNVSRINNDCDGDNIKRRLRFRRVLLVLDDVDNLEQLRKLAKSRELFSSGSRIIITTKNKRLLDQHNVDKIHEASLLTKGEASRLFSQRAFEDIHPTKEFKHLSYEVIRYADDLPLALEILGSALFRREISFWESTLKKLKKVGPHGDILAKLKIGFDGLEDPEQKDTFLDIACFFGGKNIGNVKRKLDSFGFYPDLSLPVLAERSLIYYSYGRVCMHQLIREMGRHIVRKDFTREPGKRSRLWDFEEIELVLANSTGTENIEGIMLNPTEEEHIIIEMRSEAFRKMTNLRLLEIHNSRFRQGPQYHLPNGIRWIVWDEYPSNSLPTTFKAYNLVGLELFNSSIKQLWKGRKMMDKLKYINLAHCQKLIETPDFTGIPNLEDLVLRQCRSLVVVHQSLGALKRLVHLYLGECWNLRTLPNSIQSECLKTFELTGCYKLQKFPEIPVIMKDLLHLKMEGTAIRELPSSIEHIPNLFSLNLSYCKNFASLPSTICKLKRLEKLNLWGCSKLDKLPEDLGYLESLKELHLDRTAIKEVPSSIEHLSNLTFILVDQCKNIRSFPSPICKLKRLKFLCLVDCSELDELHEELGNLESLERVCLNRSGIKELPSSIEHLSSLVHLSMNQCKNIRSLPSAMCKLKRLKCLSLKECSELDKLPEELGNLECLETLRLDGIGIKEVPSSIEHLSNLVELCLSNCKKFPSLLSAVCKLKRLKYLSLSGCSELENLPEELGSLGCLEQLHLDGTAITEPPLSIRCLNNLKTLTLSKRKRQEEEEEDFLTRSLALLSVSGLHLLGILDFSGRAIPSSGI